MTEFQPEHSGKMNFYIAVVDDLLRHPDDRPTIGMILCKSKDKTIVEYALQGMQQPIGVSTFQSEPLEQHLPTIEQLETELATITAEIEVIAPS
jgi:hypothetical protein